MFNSLQDLLNKLDTHASLLMVCAFILVIVSMFIHNKHKGWAVFVLFICALCVSSSFALMNPFLNLWDEQFHALVAKNLAEKPIKSKTLS